MTNRGIWIGWILTGLVGVFLLVDGGARLAGVAPYVEGMTKFGYAASLAPWIGAVLLVSAIAMLIRRTADARVRALIPFRS
jgi:DoxX-like protein